MGRNRAKASARRLRVRRLSTLLKLFSGVTVQFIRKRGCHCPQAVNTQDCRFAGLGEIVHEFSCKGALFFLRSFLGIKLIRPYAENDPVTILLIERMDIVHGLRCPEVKSTVDVRLHAVFIMSAGMQGRLPPPGMNMIRQLLVNCFIYGTNNS